MNTPDHSPLGKVSAYIDSYDPALLFPIPRIGKRNEIGLSEELPFHGADIWNAYELSWLTEKGKPCVALASFVFPAQSNCIIESKSFKLYLNSFNQTIFKSIQSVIACLENDLSAAVGCDVAVTVEYLSDAENDSKIGQLKGQCIDDLDVEIETYQTNPEYLTVSADVVSESLVSHLLKSNCLVTGQPDWGSVYIQYTGPKIDRPSLLKYLISFRQHNEFHEQCVERIFVDLKRACRCQTLTVYARYIRRGGLDINPFRSDDPKAVAENVRLIRQ